MNLVQDAGAHPQEGGAIRGKKRDIQKSTRKTRRPVFSGWQENTGLPREKVQENAEIAQIHAQNQKYIEKFARDQDVRRNPKCKMVH